FHPILFELLPEKFTLPQLHSLYEDIFNASLDKRNFSRKIHSAKLLIKLKEKEKENSKKGAYYFKIDKKKYKSIFYSVFNFIPNPDSHKCTVCLQPNEIYAKCACPHPVKFPGIKKGDSHSW